MKLSTDAGLTMAAYTAEPGSPTHDALNLFASWAATLDQAEAATRWTDFGGSAEPARRSWSRHRIRSNA